MKKRTKRRRYHTNWRAAIGNYCRVSRNYTQACSDLNVGVIAAWSGDYYDVLYTRTIRGKSYYQRRISPKCKQCIHTPRKNHWSGPNVCSCGNPYINASTASSEFFRSKSLAEFFKTPRKPRWTAPAHNPNRILP